MAEHSKIEWTDATWNTITGCELVDEGCRNCYAALLAATRLKNHPSRKGLARVNAAGVAKFTGEVRLNEQWLLDPIRWQRPRNIFVIAHGDIAHRNVPDDWIDKVFAVMALSNRHNYQVLTKRPGRLADYLYGKGLVGGVVGREQRIKDRAQSLVGLDWTGDFPLPNAIIGTSVSEQESADARREDLRKIHHAGFKTFVSYEPALGPVDWKGWEFVDWIISGGESGPHARPSYPDWHRATRDFCLINEIAYLFKQWGGWHPWMEPLADGCINLISFGKKPSHYYQDGDLIMSRVGKKKAGRFLDGKLHDGFPMRAA
ncbi:MAG: phage Gp37/Gp68 family protein [Nitratireductor sp.]|nr:phage Gp37/Gp68 family protein [Nitratireductor sp.]